MICPEKYTVVDIETTGLDPARDRIVEIAEITQSGARKSMERLLQHKAIKRDTRGNYHLQ